jgi:nucleoid DNA-binding protein
MAGINEIAKAAGVKSDVVSDVFEAVFQIVRDGQFVRIAGFGSFTLKVKPGRVQRSPIINGGKPLKMPDASRMFFKQSKLGKLRLNTKKKRDAQRAEKKAKKGRS